MTNEILEGYKTRIKAAVFQDEIKTIFVEIKQVLRAEHLPEHEIDKKCRDILLACELM